MRIRWMGHSCFELTFDSGLTVVTDPFDASVGYPLPDARADIVTISHAHHDHNNVSCLIGAPRTVDAEGRHEMSGAVITGVPGYHDDRHGERRGANLMFLIECDGLRVAHLGDLGHLPDDAQYRAFGRVDVLLTPVGGYYTIDGAQAAEIARRLAPGLTIPMHYKTRFTSYPIADERPFVQLVGGEYVHSDHIDFSADAPFTPDRVVVLSQDARPR